MYYIYIYLNPLKKSNHTYIDEYFEYEPFYVGRGKNNRYKVHLQSNLLNRKSLKNETINEIIDSNLEPIILIFKRDLSFIESNIMEKELILKIGRICNNTGPLTNKTTGGQGKEGYIPSTETRNKIRNTSIERGVYEKLSKSMKGEQNVMYGDKWCRSEDGIKSFKEKMDGKSPMINKNEDEKLLIYEKIKNTLKGRKLSEDVLEKRKNSEKIRKPKSKSNKVKIINIITNEEMEFNSMLKASSFLNTCKETLQYRYKKGIIFNNIKIISIESTNIKQ